MRHIVFCLISLDSQIIKSYLTVFSPYNLSTKVCLVKAMVILVVMYGYENWTIKKAQCWRIDGFKFWCWRRLLRVPWTVRISNQSILKEINPEYSLEGLMWKLKLQYFDHLMGRANSLEKTLMLGKIDGRKFVQTLGDHEGQGSLAHCSPWVRHDLATE